MRVQLAYRTDLTVNVCLSHYNNPPAGMLSLGPVLDSREHGPAGCTYCATGDVYLGTGLGTSQRVDRCRYLCDFFGVPRLRSADVDALPDDAPLALAIDDCDFAGFRAAYAAHVGAAA
jgi:hypothetical protein